MDHDRISRRSLIKAGIATTSLASLGAASGDSLSRHARKSSSRNHITWEKDSDSPQLSPAALRTVEAAITYGDRLRIKDSGLIMSDEWMSVDGRSCFFVAVACLLDGSPERKAQAKQILSQVGAGSATTGMLLLAAGRRLFDPETIEGLEAEIRSGAEGGGGEDIIAGRNINIPLGTWTRRITGAIAKNDPKLLAEGVEALKKLTDLVEAHGSHPEFNSPTYEALTLIYLRALGLTKHKEVCDYSLPLEQYLWESLAWRWHPRLKQLCGPWARAYHDSLVGASGIVPMMADVAWGAFFDQEVAYQYQHAHDHPFGAILPFLLQTLPLDVSHIALEKNFPLTITSAAEQVVVRMGEESHLTWVPGGIAELTTWMDENLAVGSASRSHLHAMQNGTYIAQWTRSGKPVEKLSDLGQAFTRFVQNGQRPGNETHSYRNYHGGYTLQFGAKLWADGGRPFALQSGPTALILYVPRGRERWFVQRLEAFMVFPRLETIDEVLVDGVAVEQYEGSPDQSVVVRSGKVAMGLKFAACDTTLTSPRLIVEHSRDHLLVGLRLVEYPEERELSALEYRRYAATIGTELRFTPTEKSVQHLLQDMKQSSLTDEWDMAFLGGHREVDFRIAEKKLYGRFEPMAETWLRKITTPPDGSQLQLAYDRKEYLDHCRRINH